MVDVLGVALAIFFTLVVVATHYARGTTWRASTDISQKLLERRAATVPETDFPEPMNRSVGGGGVAAIETGAEGELEEMEVEEEEGPDTIPDDEAAVFEVEYVKEGETIEVAENETLLDAGEDEGWDLPYACREGQCLSCGGRVVDGPAEDYVVHWHQEMLNEDELGDGYTLTCVAYPKADLTLETREAP